MCNQLSFAAQQERFIWQEQELTICPIRFQTGFSQFWTMKKVHNILLSLMVAVGYPVIITCNNFPSNTRV